MRLQVRISFYLISKAFPSTNTTLSSNESDSTSDDFDVVMTSYVIIVYNGSICAVGFTRIRSSQDQTMS
jgi:hypothetical protein